MAPVALFLYAAARDEPNRVNSMTSTKASHSFVDLWASRFGKVPDTKVIEHHVYTWAFDRSFAARCPALTAALKQSSSYRVRIKNFGVEQRRIACFWIHTSGKPLVWLLHPSDGPDADMKPPTHLPTCSVISECFRGFDKGLPRMTPGSDFPIELEEFDEVFLLDTESVPDRWGRLYSQLCDDADFVSRMERMCQVAVDPAGNRLVVGEMTEHLFFLSTDGDWFGRRGCQTIPIGSGDTSAYSLKRTPTLPQLLECCGQHVLQEIDSTD
jgi:hypothetical protein